MAELAPPRGRRSSDLAAVGSIAAWLVPLAALIVLAWRRPPFALPAFVALTAAVLGLNLWAGVQAEPWRVFEDYHSRSARSWRSSLPSRSTVYGLHRPRDPQAGAARRRLGMDRAWRRRGVVPATTAAPHSAA